MSGMPAAGQRLRLIAACGAILYIALFWQLGSHTFWDPDEAHYAETTREMLQGGDWLAPQYNGQPFFDKPIFFHWLQGAAMSLGPRTEALARFPGALAGVLLVLFTGWAGARLMGPRVGWVAALLLAVNPGLFGLARYAILDAPFTLALFGGVTLLGIAAAEQRPRMQWAGYLLLALAVLIKGPVALALSGVALAIAAITSREARERLFSLHWISGLLLIVLIATPWFVYMLWRYRSGFVDGYILNENLTLFSAPPYGNQPGWSFYLQILAVGLLPWTGLILGRAWDQLRSRSTISLADVMLWSWAAGVTLFFSASRFKLDHYIFPAAPALCIVAARAWVDAQNGVAGAGTRAGAAIVGPVLMLAGGVVAMLAIERLDLPAGFLVVPALIIVFGALATWQRIAQRGVVPAPAVAALVVLYAGVVMFILPALERGKVVPELARWVQANADAGTRIGTFHLNRWNPVFRFYVERPVTMFDDDEQARRFFSDPSPFYCVMTEDYFEALKRAGVPLEAAVQREGVWATSGRLLWRAKGRPTVFVVARRAA